MKISRTLLVGLFITVFVIAAIVLGVLYNGAGNDHKTARSNLDQALLSQSTLNKEKAALGAQLAQAVADVASWNSKIALLQAQLAQAGVSLKQTQGGFPASAQTIEYLETLSGLAKASNLTLSLASATETAPVNLSTSDFTFYSNAFTISVRGKTSDILDFIDRVATNGAFKTAVLSPVKFTIPQPLTQAAKDAIRKGLRDDAIAEKTLLIQGVDKVKMIETALLELLGGTAHGLSVEEMTQQINDIISARFSPAIADMLSQKITDAIQKDLADSLISTVASIYTNAITSWFTDQNTAGLVPSFTDFVGSVNYPANSTTTDTIDTLVYNAIKDIPLSAMPGVISRVLVDEINANIDAQIAKLVDDNAAAIDAAAAGQVAELEMPSADISVAVYSYKGD